MGVEYRGVICVGYTYEEVEQLYEVCLDDNGDYKYENLYEFCEGEGLTSYSPHYDADADYCIYGDEVTSSPDYHYSVVGIGLDESIKQVSDTLEATWKVKPKTYIMAHGW